MKLPFSARVSAFLFLLIVTIWGSMQAVRAADMFTPPNAEAKMRIKYFNEHNSFIYCLNAYDIVEKKFKSQQFCVKKDAGQDRLFIDTDIPLAKVDAPEIIIRYNTLDRGLVDKRYPVAPESENGKSAFVVNPEDRLDVINTLMVSKDVIVFYNGDGREDYQMMYYPLPVRGSDGTVPFERVD